MAAMGSDLLVGIDPAVWADVIAVAGRRGVSPSEFASRVLGEVVRSEHVTIYALVDPRTQEPRYVGRTVDPVGRFRDHCADRSGAKGAWVAELRSEDLRPEMIVLSRTSSADGPDAEQEWIDRLVAEGFDLLNVVGVTRRKRVVSMRLGEEMAQWVDDYAALRGVTRQAILETAILNFHDECERGVPDIASC